MLNVNGEGEDGPLRLGSRFGDCQVERVLGRGGVGAVYLVSAPGGEQYAVKVLRPDIANSDPDYKVRFMHEAEFMMTLRHKNLVTVYDAGEDPEMGMCYIVMEYMPGGSVKDRLCEHGAMPVPEAISIAAQIADALGMAHFHGVIHRDVKPDNILFSADGVPKLSDLGVAKFLKGATCATETMKGIIIGTPAYMAPEQMMDSGNIDARADIYSLGVVLYEMLTGKRPNDGSTVMGILAKAIKGEEMPDVRTMRPEVSAAVAYVLSLMCSPKPENRPETSRAVADLLVRAAADGLILPKKPLRTAVIRRKKSMGGRISNFFRNIADAMDGRGSGKKDKGRDDG